MSIKQSKTKRSRPKKGTVPLLYVEKYVKYLVVFKLFTI